MSSFFSSAIRRALRSPLTSSVVHSTRRFISHSSPSLLPRSLPPSSTNLSPFSLSSRFLSSGSQGEPEQRLKRVLEAEIIHAEESDEVAKEIKLPKGFPFSIVDNPGEQMITLKRDFSGENIEVEVYMPDVQGEEEGDGDTDDESEGEGNSSEDVAIPLVVRIDKEKDIKLEFTCTATPEGIEIDEMLLKGQEDSADHPRYEGPKFLDLDEGLQQAALKYLEARGIDGSLKSFLEGYMINKDGREYLGWLKNIKDFVAK